MKINRLIKEEIEVEEDNLKHVKNEIKYELDMIEIDKEFFKILKNHFIKDVLIQKI